MRTSHRRIYDSPERRNTARKMKTAIRSKTTIRSIWFPLIIGILFAVWALGKPAAAETALLDLSDYSVTELHLLESEIEREKTLHHTVSDSVREAVLRTVQTVTEELYAQRGITVSWAWYDWEYEYSRDGDFLTFASHLDYKDKSGKGYRNRVNAGLYYDGETYHVYRLKLDNEVVINEEKSVPAEKLVAVENAVIDRRSALNLSLLSVEELNALENRIRQEMDANHTPRETDRVNAALRQRVDAFFAEKGVSVEWPWFDYEYTCDWDCYTEKTRITYELDGVRHENEPVYAEIFPADEGYRVYYLTVGDAVILDERDTVKEGKAFFFLQNRKYDRAGEYRKIADYEKALEIYTELGDFKDAAALSGECREALLEISYRQAADWMEKGKYERAAEAFDALGDFGDSREQAEACRLELTKRAYRAAQILQRRGEYQKAYDAFSALADYGDSRQKMAECEESMREIAYRDALKKQEEGKTEEALTAFEALADYRDSRELAEACRETIRAAAYETAESLEAEGELAQALEIFRGIADYRDSGERILALEEALRRQKYEAAEALARAGDYEEAIAAFESLGSYGDSAERASQLSGILGTIDREIRLEETEYHLFPGNSLELRPEITGLTENAAAETALLYTSDNPNAARVSKEGVVTAVRAGDAVIHLEAADNPYIVKEVTVHVVKNVGRILLDQTRMEVPFPAAEGSETIQLHFRTDPEDAWIQTGVWSSDNEEAVRIHADGTLEILGLGRATVTLTSDDDTRGVKKASCSVNVVRGVEKVEIQEAPEVFYVGKQAQLKAAIAPQDAANKKLTWTSSDESVATVSAAGVVKGVSVGTVTITAASLDGPSASLRAEVRMAPAKLRITASAKCLNRNRVGRRWTQEFRLNDEAFKGNTTLTVENGDVIRVGCTLRENDSEPEENGFDQEITITPEIMQKGLTIDETVLVKENNGPYAGREAKWRVVITLRP